MRKPTESSMLVNIETSLYQRFRSLCLVEGKTMKQVVRALVIAYCENELLKTTLKRIEEKKGETIKDLVKKVVSEGRTKNA